MQPRYLICSILLATAIIGCSRNNPLGRQAISGEVTLDGAMLDYGNISFFPQAPGGVSSGAVVNNGLYSIPTLKGLPPGKYLVQITSTAPNPKDKDRPTAGIPLAPGGLPGIGRIAPMYNMQSKIMIEIVAGQEANFNFDTKSK